ncbi:hypothetical protein FJZ36_19385, partial [Candidatus Poribacteria bacterium]|nr:hypothetical protein [Candidatus Poribacteria bacterium]
MTRRHIAALALCLTTLSLRVSAAPVPDLVGVRPVGLGDAYTALADQAEGAIHNPASLGVREGVWLFGQT